MAFSSAVTENTVWGNMRVVMGTFTNTDTDAGGDIDTGLKYIQNAAVNVTSHVDSAMPKVFVNKTIAAGAAANGYLGLVCGEGVDGTWTVWGK